MCIRDSFISDNRRALFDRIGMGEDHIEHRMLSRGIENAQKRIESRNFDARKNLLEYDDVSNDQRQAIYSLRNQLLEEDDISLTIENLIEDQFTLISNNYIPTIDLLLADQLHLKFEWEWKL